MEQKIQEIERIIEIFNPANSADLELFKIKLLSKKGLITNLFVEFKNIEPAKKKELGAQINKLKDKALNRIEEFKLKFLKEENFDFQFDLNLTSIDNQLGTRHPISLIKNDLYKIFQSMGFTYYEGPEIEDDWHVFSSLNFPKEHPARDMQDTFFIEKNPDILLRTHTSSVQVRSMEKERLPIRIICPGRVFRNEAISARAHCIFHQIEGLYIDKEVSFADLKQCLMHFAKELFGQDTSIRLRPSFFPFTEPSAEMDITCKICHGKGCPVCKYTGWLEIMGCGMVDPNVLEFNNIDSKVYTGYAFGMGLERIAMLKYQVKDLRLYFENDVRFLDYFKNYY